MKALMVLGIISLNLFAIGEIVEVINTDELESVCMSRTCKKQVESNATKSGNQPHPWFKETGW